jgi:hypothetical protein
MIEINRARNCVEGKEGQHEELLQQKQARYYFSERIMLKNQQ